jgi:hypothetical protein
MFSCRLLFVAVCWFLCMSLGSLRAQNEVTLETLEGQSLRGQLQSIGASGELKGNGLPDPLNLGLVSLIDFGRPVRAAAEGNVSLRLVGGGSVWIRKPLIEAEKLTFESDSLQPGVPLETIAAIVWKENDRVKEAVAAPLSDNDQVLVETAEGTVVVAGLLEGMTADKLQINYQDKSRTIGLEKVLALVPASVGKVAGNQVAGNSVRLALQDGSLVLGQFSSLDATSWSVKLPNGATLSGPSSAVSRIEVASDRRVYLSDLTPLESEQRVLFGQPRDWTKDTAIDGSPIRLRRATNAEPALFRKGLGMRATTRLLFANDKQFNRLQAEVGLDPELGQQGDCEVVVRGDGIELWKQRLFAGKLSDQVDLDISGYSRVELAVLPGEQFDLGDFVNWANPRMLKLER